MAGQQSSGRQRKSVEDAVDKACNAAAGGGGRGMRIVRKVSESS
jgi:acetyl/propionyl-CoA carboxylase alpha subunit